MDTLYDPAAFFGDKLAATRGDPDSALQQVEVTHEADYVMPIGHRNPMEPSASMAHWDGDDLMLYETTQWVEFHITALQGTACLSDRSPDLPPRRVYRLRWQRQGISQLGAEQLWWAGTGPTVSGAAAAD
jgi:hypothetical protein